MTCNRIVCGCQLWEYSNDFDGKEFCVGSLDFMKGRVVFEFIVQLLLILKTLTLFGLGGGKMPPLRVFDKYLKNGSANLYETL